MTTLVLMNTTDDRKVVFKNTTEIQTISCSVYDYCDVLNPKLLLTYASYLAQSNYAYIPEWNRYYYIESMLLMPGGRVMLSLSIDVLKTYSNQIGNITCPIARQENFGMSRIPDNNIVLQNYNPLEILSFSDGYRFIGNRSYVLNVVGGV